MALKGRHWLAIWSAAFLAVVGAVAVRQQSALRAARALDVARTRRATLEAQRADLERRIRRAESREVLVPAVSRALGLRFPADSEIVILRVPARNGR